VPRRQLVELQVVEVVRGDAQPHAPPRRRDNAEGQRLSGAHNLEERRGRRLQRVERADGAAVKLGEGQRVARRGERLLPQRRGREQQRAARLQRLAQRDEEGSDEVGPHGERLHHRDEVERRARALARQLEAAWTARADLGSHAQPRPRSRLAPHAA